MMSLINAIELTNKLLIIHTIVGIFADFSSNIIFKVLILVKII